MNGLFWNYIRTIFVWAAGNGKHRNDNCNYDGYANMRYTITIGSVNWRGQATWYSEVVFPLLISLID
jgi:hypothetical protein